KEAQELLACDLGRRPASEPPNDVETSILRSDPELGAPRIVESGRRDADHGERTTQLRQIQVATDDRRIAAERALPRRVAENDRRARGRTVPPRLVARLKEAAQHRIGSENREKVVGDDGLAQDEAPVAVCESLALHAPVRQSCRAAQ